MKIRINEIFYSIQGEGKSAGEPVLFVRLSGCSLNCSFCDSKYHKEERDLSAEDINLLNTHKRWVITGGEPLLQQDAINHLMKLFAPNTVEIETNGTIIANTLHKELISGFNISPKEQRFQVPKTKITEPTLLTQKHRLSYILKFVYSDKKSRKFIEGIVSDYKIPSGRVWIMPEGETEEKQKEKEQEVWDYCIEKGYNFSPRLHVNVWGDKREV